MSLLGNLREIIELTWRLGYSQPMIVVMRYTLNVRGSDIFFDVDLRLFLSSLLGGANSATESFSNDLGGLGLGQE